MKTLHIGYMKCIHALHMSMKYTTCVGWLSCILHPCISPMISVPHFPVLHFQSTMYLCGSLDTLRTASYAKYR